ncbi:MULTISPECIES: TetR family transcriptional regulator [unclassified Acidisoma]|jgi:hypothetical protein|uniref:TetR family transcriptional regulator n=1 Tax=unclassified Acidisoma TaxID=2634065 RepID=UPI00131A7125
MHKQFAASRARRRDAPTLGACCERTSFAELGSAMRIGHATFYSKFKSKEELCREAARHYIAEYAGFFF